MTVDPFGVFLLVVLALLLGFWLVPLKWRQMNRHWEAWEEDAKERRAKRKAPRP